MNHKERFLGLLQAYEELTTLETFALSEDNLPYLSRLQKKKGNLSAKLPELRQLAALSPEESKRVDFRLRALEATERSNLDRLQVAMRSVSESLAGLNTHRVRCTRLRSTYRTSGGGRSGSLAGTA